MPLLKYQKAPTSRGLSILYDKGLVYLAYETRVGKTPCAFWIAQQIKAGSVLFTSTKRAIKGAAEFFREFRDEYDFDLDFINYESLHKIRRRYDLYICDESHRLGTFPKPSKRQRAMRAITGAKPVIFTSATPTPESLSQIYHQLQVSAFSPFGQWLNFYRWADKFVTKREKYVGGGRPVIDYSNAKRNLVMPIISPYIVTLTQEQAGFLQKVKDEIHMVDMTPQTKSLLKRFMKSGVLQTHSGDYILGDSAPKMSQKHHQLSSGTVITEEGRGLIVDRSKAVYILKNFTPPFAVYYLFQAEGRMLMDVLGRRWRVTNDEHAFQRGEADVFIAQFQSGREGVKLDRSNKIIMFNIDFSFLSYEQTRNRIQSVYRDQEATVHWLFNADKETAIEPEIWPVVKNKRKYTSVHYSRRFLK